MTDAATMTQNRDGEWVPMIPLPVQGLVYECPWVPANDAGFRWCGRRFWTLAGYRGHYALVHVLKLEEKR